MHRLRRTKFRFQRTNILPSVTSFSRPGTWFQPPRTSFSCPRTHIYFPATQFFSPITNAQSQRTNFHFQRTRARRIVTRSNRLVTRTNPLAPFEKRQPSRARSLESCRFRSSIHVARLKSSPSALHNHAPSLAKLQRRVRYPRALRRQSVGSRRPIRTSAPEYRDPNQKRWCLRIRRCR